MNSQGQSKLDFCLFRHRELPPIDADASRAPFKAAQQLGKLHKL
jgi:hypothetical protein